MDFYFINQILNGEYFYSDQYKNLSNYFKHIKDNRSSSSKLFYSKEEFERDSGFFGISQIRTISKNENRRNLESKF